MKKSLIATAGVAALAIAAVPAAVFAADDRSATDTITVTVDPSCTFKAGGDDAAYAVTSSTNASGQVNPTNNSSNVHTFTVFCNQNSGYTVTAEATALSATGITDNFAYKASLPSSGADGAWHAQFAADEGNVNTLTMAQLADNGAEKTIVTSGQASSADGETFTATYTAYVGTETPAGTYSGTIKYTLVPGA